MFQDDLLKNNVIEELLRERTTYYLSQKKKRDFWVILNPALFTETEKTLISNSYYVSNEKKKQTEDYYAVFISTNKELVNWIALRLGEFEEITSLSLFSKSKVSVSNGIRGQKETISSFKSCSDLKEEVVSFFDFYQAATRNGLTN
jgi:hypothetical protein